MLAFEIVSLTGPSIITFEQPHYEGFAITVWFIEAIDSLDFRVYFVAAEVEDFFEG